MKQLSQTIGFIGGGNMGSSLINGLLSKGVDKSHIILAEPNPQQAQKLRDQWAIYVSDDNRDIAHQADVLVLAVKPQNMRTVVEGLQGFDRDKTLLLSIAAGITTAQIQHWLGEPETAIIRAMPNTPALVGHGITGLYAKANINPTQRQIAQLLMQSVGETVWIEDESLMDVVTALSGSGPAYFFYMMEGLIQGAQQLGLPPDIARKLTLNTALGSAVLALQQNEDLQVLRERVTSKGGTTEQGINVLKDGKLGDLLAKVLTAATARGKSLSDEYN